MLTLRDRLRPRQEDVTASVIDGEAIIINLGNGFYYSMDQVGALIWELIEAQHSVEEMAGAIIARYEVSAEQAHADVARLLADLCRENLVVALPDGVSTNAMGEPAQRERLRYESPTLNIYRDMGDLLALDPPTLGLSEAPWKDPEDDSSR
jgi:hypothetical protein